MQDFYQLYQDISRYNPPTPEQVHTKVKDTSYLPFQNNVVKDCSKYFQAKQWVNDFTNMEEYSEGFQKKNVTPYMHIVAYHMHVLAYHVPEMIRLYGNIKQF